MNSEVDTPKPINVDWKADIDHEDAVTLDDLKFIFAQAEKRLDDGIKNFDATTSKSISFITLTTAILTTLSAYFFVNLDIHGVFSPRLFTVLICSLYTFYVLYNFINIILPKSYQPIGSFPEHLYNNTMFDNDTVSTKKTTLYLYLAELQNYNRRIKENADVNNGRLKLFTKSVKFIVVMPGVGVVLYSVMLWFFPSL